MPDSRPVPTVLVVDNDDVAIEGVLRALRRHDVPCRALAAGDGREALGVLRGEQERDPRASTLVLLDLNMPGMDGFDFLTELRADEGLRPTVVFVLSTSSRRQDLYRAYMQNVAGYMVKPALGPQLVKLGQFLNSYLRSQALP